MRRCSGLGVRDRDLENIERAPQRPLQVHDCLCQIGLGAHFGGRGGSQSLLDR